MAIEDGNTQAEESSHPGPDIPGEIEQIKVEILYLLADRRFDPSLVPHVLEHLQLAETAVDTGDSRAWYQLVRAKLVLHQMRYPPSSNERVDFSEGWHELEEDQRRYPEANFEEAANWLHGAEKTLADTLPGPCVFHSLTIPRQLRARAREGLRWRKWGYTALIVEMAYLVALSGVLFICPYYFDMNPLEALKLRMVHIPLYIFVWGFLGGVTWCTYSAADGLMRRLFDSYQLGWYVAHPWISALLGATAVLVVLGGLSTVSSVTLDAEDSSPTAAVALLSLVSFATGYSTIFIWAMLDNVIHKMFGEVNLRRALDEKVQDHLPKKSNQ